MSFTLTAPESITVGQPIPFSFTSETRVGGRVRLTAGTEALTYRLQNEAGETSEPGAGHRVRGKSGPYALLDWGEHAEGTELVLRFEGHKVWMTVKAGA